MSAAGHYPLSIRHAVIAIVLAPFLTIFFDFSQALYLQAVLITLLTIAVSPPGIQAVQRFLRHAPLVIQWSLGILLLVIFQGTAMGLFGGFSLSQVGGQALSMFLLPFGAFVAYASAEEGIFSGLSRGLLVGALIGGAIQIAWGIIDFQSHSSLTRLFLPNAVSIVPILLMALLFSAAELIQQDRWNWTLPCQGVLLILLLFSSLRSLWILAPFSAFLFLLLWRGWDLRRISIIFLVCILMVGLIAAGVHSLLQWLEQPRPNLISASGAEFLRDNTTHTSDHETGSFILSGMQLENRHHRGRQIPVPESPALVLLARSRGGENGAIVIVAEFFNEQGKPCGRLALPLLPSENATQQMATSPIPETALFFRLKASSWSGSSGQWEILSLRCSTLSSAFFSRAAGEALALQQRISGLLDAVISRRPTRDATLSFRWTESKKALRAFRQASVLKRAFGHGLGSTLLLDTDGFDNRGHWIHYDRVNYLHNWYLFLLYKLGIVGTVLVLGCFGCWIFLLLGKLRRQVLGSPGRAATAAALCSFLLYLIWSLTSPEFLDFRMAPLWGFLLAATLTLRNDVEAKGNNIENPSERLLRCPQTPSML